MKDSALLQSRIRAALHFCEDQQTRVDFYRDSVTASYRVSMSEGMGRVSARGEDFLQAIEALKTMDPEKDARMQRSDPTPRRRKRNVRPA